MDKKKTFGLPPFFTEKKVRQLEYPGKSELAKKVGGVFTLPCVSEERIKGDFPRFWDVPAEGGYWGGYKTGEAMAQAFLRALRHLPHEDAAPGITWAFEGFLHAMNVHGGSQPLMDSKRGDIVHGGPMDSLRGQYVGFFNTVNKWIFAAAKNLGPSLDKMDMETLTEKANAGIRFDSAAYQAYLENNEDEEGDYDE